MVHYRSVVCAGSHDVAAMRVLENENDLGTRSSRQVTDPQTGNES